MTKKVAITAISSISALGNNANSIWNNYLKNNHFLVLKAFENQKKWVACLDLETQNKIFDLQNENSKYKFLDKSVLFAIFVSRLAIAQAGWKKGSTFGINIGSSRGATALFESSYKDFLTSGKTQTLTSPTTTLGNISSWVAHDLQTSGPEISHSITCSTALHGLLNGVAWLQAGMANQFLVGGSEAPLTAFTIAQMEAMKIYSQSENGANDNNNFPCRALDFEKKQNSLVLAEAASVCCLEMGECKNALAYVAGIGYATEILEHSVSLSTEAICFQKSMTMALKNIDLNQIDAIVMHAPGTVLGDLSEYKAIKKIFGSHLPLLTTNKWKLGHSFGASGMLSIEMAILMIKHNTFISVPFAKATLQTKPIRSVLVNAVGFGGNAVSILLEAP